MEDVALVQKAAAVVEVLAVGVVAIIGQIMLLCRTVQLV